MNMKVGFGLNNNLLINRFTPVNTSFQGAKKNDKSLQKDVFERSETTSIDKSLLPEPSLDDFNRRYKYRFKKSKNLNSLVRFINGHIKNENLLGQGKHSKVYKFSDDNFSNYVIKCIKPEGSMTLPINLFPDINLGQPIAQIGDNMFILKRQEGVEHSFHNWGDIINGRADISRQQALKFCDDIQKISKFPDESYEEYASKLKLLFDNGYKSDSLNPNNMLIDYKNQKLNFVDFYLANRPAKKECYVDMVVSILDYRLYPQILNLLTPNEQEKFLASSKEIIEKCYNAAENVGLSTDKEIFKAFIDDLDIRWSKGKLNEDYEKFKDCISII